MPQTAIFAPAQEWPPPPEFFTGEFFTPASGAPLTPDQPAFQQAQAHLLTRTADGMPVARCSLWWETTAPLHGRPTGYIGHFAAPDMGAEAAVRDLLATACHTLRAAGCAWAIGPIDGSTFRDYRFVIQRHVNAPQEPPFFLEPQNPDAWPRHFVANGFAPIATYCSAVGKLPPHDPHLDRLMARAKATGATLRPVRLEAFQEELASIYAVVATSFRHNFLYTPLAQAEFVAQYLPLQAVIQPELGWVAERDERMVGFILALPNLAQAQRGEAIDTAIIKTVAAQPQGGVLGLGNLLIAQCQQAAYAAGYRRVIHALMHEDNISTKISARYAQIMRRYALYASPLETRSA